MKIDGIENKWINNSSALYSDISKQIDDFSEYILKAKEMDDINVDPWKELQNKYPNIVFNTGDIEMFDEKNLIPYRQDFPVSKLFEENADIEKLASWKPSKGKNPPSGFEDYIQADRARITKGKYAIMIHPDVKARMDNDPQYAKDILNKIDTFFQKEIMIEEELVPGSTLGMNQFVAIDKEGKIAYNISVSHGTGSYEEPYQNNITPSLIRKIEDLCKDTNIKLDIMSIFPDNQMIQSTIIDNLYDNQMSNTENLWEIWKKKRLLHDF